MDKRQRSVLVETIEDASPTADGMRGLLQRMTYLELSILAEDIENVRGGRCKVTAQVLMDAAFSPSQAEQ